MKKRILALTSLVALVVSILISCGKDGLEHTLDRSVWEGQMEFYDEIEGVDADGNPIMQIRVDTLTCMLAFNATHCRWSGAVTRSIDNENDGTVSTFDYFGAYDYEKGEGTFYNDATMLSGGRPFAFSVADSSKLTLNLPANILNFNQTATNQTLTLHQRTNMVY